MCSLLGRSSYLELSLSKMKSLLTVLLLGIALLLPSLSYATSDRETRAPAYVLSAPPKTSVEALYRQKCSKCHGGDGTGDTSMGRIFNAPDFTDGGWWAHHSDTAGLITVINRGKKNMPAFGKKLSRSQISSLASYVQRFKQ
jgi:cytochrome c6